MTGLWRIVALLLVLGGSPSAGGTSQDPARVARTESAEVSAALLPAAEPPTIRRSAHAQRVERVLRGEAPLADRQRRLLALKAELGLGGLEPAALALLHARQLGSPLERARAAVALAPGLPVAHASLASASWADGDWLGALRSGLGAAKALPGHFDSALWLEVTTLETLGRVCLWAGLLFLCVLAAFELPRAAHDLGDFVLRVRRGDRERTEMPTFARAALLATLLLLPVALGQGILGLCVGLFALAVARGGRSRRIAAAVAMLMVLAAVHPVAQRAERTLARAAFDPVASPAWAALQDLPSGQDRARLAHAAEEDPGAALALALAEKREGRFEAADALLAPHASRSDAPELLNNAANLRLVLGDTEGAVRLYEQAAASSDRPVVLFNLSQAYGQAIRLEQQDAALARAQTIDASAVTRLIVEQGDRPAGVYDLPVEVGSLRAAMRLPNAAGSSRPHPAAPGALGRQPILGFAAVFVTGFLAILLSRRARPSRSCGRCGSRMCPRCDRTAGAEGLCEPCTRLTHRPETTDPTMRMARMAALRRRQRRLRFAHRASALLIPGSAGLLGGRAMRGLLAASAFAAALACGWAPVAAPPDPGSVGNAGIVFFGVSAGLAALAYLALILPGVRPPRSG